MQTQSLVVGRSLLLATALAGMNAIMNALTAECCTGLAPLQSEGKMKADRTGSGTQAQVDVTSSE